MPEQPSTTRVAFRIRLREGKLDEYVKAHDRISEDWPELEQAIRDSGIERMRIIAVDSELYVVADVTDENAFPRLRETAAHRAWDRIMQPLMEADEAAGQLAPVIIAYSFDAH